VKMLKRDRRILARRLILWGYTPGPRLGARDRYNVPKLYLDSLTDDRLLDDLATYQRFHSAPLDDLCQRIHGRKLRANGEIGPATLVVMNERTCDVPDRLPAQDGSTDYARWPDSCKDNITISWNFDKEPGLTEEQTQQVWESVPKEFNRLFQMKVELRKDQYPATRIAAISKSLPGSTLAWSYLADDNCASNLRQAYDNTTTWSVQLATGTRKHECGHAFGLNHTPNDPDSLMYPSMRGQTKLNKTDVAQMLRIGYKLREDAPPPKPNVSVVVTVDGKTYWNAWPVDDQQFPM